VNGAPVSRLSEVAWQLRSVAPGVKLVLGFVRRGRERELILTMPALSEEVAPHVGGLHVGLPRSTRWWLPLNTPLKVAPASTP